MTNPTMEEQVKDLMISKDKITLHKEYVLGRGGYGYVCYAKLERDDGYFEDVAAKMMVTVGSIPKNEKKELLKEACKLKEVSRHDNIVKLLGVLMEVDNYGLILELMVFANSVHFINQYAVVWPQNKLPIQLCQQVASAMAYLHGFIPPMLHMDLKGDNILVNHDFDAKICDFGITEWKTKTTRPAGSRAGTISHIAPEILIDVNIKSTTAQDMYSYGICTWEIFTGLKPYSNKSDEVIKSCVKDGQRPDMRDIGERCPDYIVDMMKLCWNQDSSRRPDFNALNTQLLPMCKKMKREVFLGKKAVRRQICKKHIDVNDIRRLMTDHWDDLDDSLNDTGEISVDAWPIPPRDTADTVQPQAGIPTEKPDNVPEAIKQYKETAPLPGKQYKFSLPKKDLSAFDTKIREILRDPLLLEMIMSGNADHLDLPEGVKDLLSNPALLQKYIEEDTSFKLELKGRGHSIYDSIHCPKIKDAKHKGSIVQLEASGTQTFRFSVYDEEKRGYEKNAREKKQDERTQTMLTSPYFGKLYKTGLYDKVMKALKEPHQVQEALTDLEKGNGEVEMFSIIGQDVLEVLQDPVMLNILLKNDKEALDTFMRNYSELTMKLLARNKTSYVPGKMGSRGRFRDKDFPFSRRRRDPFDRDRFGRDPYDSDSDEEMSDLMRMAYRNRIPGGMGPWGMGPAGDMDKQMLEMLIREERRKMMDEDYRRHQKAVKKDKKQEPVIKQEPEPSKPATKIEPMPSKPATKIEPMPSKPATKIEPMPSKTAIKVEPKISESLKVEPKPSDSVPKIEPKVSEPVQKKEPGSPQVDGNNKRSPGPAKLGKESSAKEIKLEPKLETGSASTPKTPEYAKVPSDTGSNVTREQNNAQAMEVTGDPKSGGVVTPKKQRPLSLEASMDEMSLDDTADGVVLYSDADRTTVDDKLGVTEAITVMKNLLQSRVPNLQLKLIDELPVSGMSEFDYINYILQHFNYIFIYVTPNFTPDTLKRFQSQMCLCDTIQNNSWRVIPIEREKGIKNIPLELQVLKSLQMWNLQSPNKGEQDMCIEGFVRTLLVGRERNYATRYPSLGTQKNHDQRPDAATAVPSTKQIPDKQTTPSGQRQGTAGSQVPNPSFNNTTEEDAELESDEESLTEEGKPLPAKASPGLHTLTHKHSGGGKTTINFIPGRNTPNLQVGNKNIMVIGPSGNVVKTKTKSRKPKENVKLTESEEPVSPANMDDVCSEIGQVWRRLCRKMGFSEGECEQFWIDFNASGIYEVTYQAMRRWLQKRPGEATQKNLAAMLHDLDRDDLATKI